MVLEKDDGAAPARQASCFSQQTFFRVKEEKQTKQGVHCVTERTQEAPVFVCVTQQKKGHEPDRKRCDYVRVCMCVLMFRVWVNAS